VYILLCFFQREQQTAEIMMIQKMMNEDLKETLEEEKRTVKRNPGKKHSQLHNNCRLV
jgi:NTP pyrophosphatase (non-canonical NTP hydrolase)